MHPDLFSFSIPGFLQGIFPPYLTVHTYGFCIFLGALGGFWYLARQSRRLLNVDFDTVVNMTFIIIIAAFVGGKIFFFLEEPRLYLAHPANMIHSLGAGFVFYGSLIFAIPSLIWYLKKAKIPVLPLLDIIATTTCILHACGRMGCFFAGCCGGKPTNSPFAVVFSNPACQADYIGVPVHPTQLYEVFLNIVIIFILWLIRRNQRFQGQQILVYVMLYAAGRGLIEIFRGDPARGFIIPDVLSYSQFVSILLIICAIIFYRRLSGKNKANG